MNTGFHVKDLRGVWLQTVEYQFWQTLNSINMHLMLSADRGIYVIGFTFPVVPKGMFCITCETNVKSETNA